MFNVIEPQEVFELRRSQRAAPGPCRKPASAEQAALRQRGDNHTTARILVAVADYGSEPMPVISLAAQVVRENYGRSEQRVRMVEVLKLTGALVREGRLQRIARRYVTLAPGHA